MTKVDRLQTPIFSRYNEKSVEDALKKDFFKKCYICEESTRHFEVDHFYPQKFYGHLVNQYENLFYICQKCNKLKPKIINTYSGNEILDCCKLDPAEYIKLKLNSKECKVEVEQIKNNSILNIIISETIKLLNRIVTTHHPTKNPNPNPKTLQSNHDKKRSGSNIRSWKRSGCRDSIKNGRSYNSS